VQGVSTRKVKAITEELCGHSFSASSISAMNQGTVCTHEWNRGQDAGRTFAEGLEPLSKPGCDPRSTRRPLH
jgi:hypothetical protein